MSPFRDSQGSSALGFSLVHLAHTHATPGQEARGTDSQATRLSTRGDCAPQDTFGDVRRHFLLSQLGGEGILLGLVVEVRDLLGTAAPHRRQLHDSSARRGSPCSRENRLPFPDASRGLPVRRMGPCAWSLSQMWAPTHLQMW